MSDATSIHKIRNHLNTISMNAEVSKMMIDRDADMATLKRNLTIITNECQKCSEYLSNLYKDMEDDQKQPPQE